MKYTCLRLTVIVVTSLPTRGGWIEILIKPVSTLAVSSLPTRGGWIEMKMYSTISEVAGGPSPHGEGGLKCNRKGESWLPGPSLPTRGGWIEIGKAIAQGAMRIGPSPHGEGGLKYLSNVCR